MESGRDRIGIGVALVLTLLWGGSIAAALNGRATEWSERLTGTPALHVVGGALLAAIVVNLLRSQESS